MSHPLGPLGPLSSLGSHSSPGQDKQLSPIMAAAVGQGHVPHDQLLQAAGGASASSSSYQRYREMTIDEMLLENRVIFLVGEINYSSSINVIMRLLHLQNQKKGLDINLYINSPGGSVDDTLAIYDTMRFLSCDVATYCIGRAQSGGAILLASGTKGKRYILPHARVMIHQPFGGVYGQASDVQIQAEEILKTKDQLNQLLANHTGKEAKQIEEDSERDRFFSAQEAKDYGLVDEVLSKGGEAETIGGTNSPAS